MQQCQCGGPCHQYAPRASQGVIHQYVMQSTGSYEGGRAPVYLIAGWRHRCTVEKEEERNDGEGGGKERRPELLDTED